MLTPALNRRPSRLFCVPSTACRGPVRRVNAILSFKSPGEENAEFGTGEQKPTNLCGPWAISIVRNGMWPVATFGTI